MLRALRTRGLHAMLFLAAALGLAAGDSAALEELPRPYALQPQIRFWTRVYTEVDTHGGFIHDANYLDVVYETLRFPEDLSPSGQQAQVDEQKAAYRRILLDLADGKRTSLSPAEKRVLSLWPRGVSSATLRTAAENIRFQLGQADRFREGVERSGAWEAFVEQTLVAQGVPRELAALPHVESSYNPNAYSSVGAAGMWQFMRSTGRRFMRVDDVVDERLDPWKATEAAALYLKENHEVTGSWPLAITGYNHGAGGMRRASRELGTREIATIVRRYKGPSFGFASRNFYTCFLAASDVSKSPETYFGRIAKSPPANPREIVLSRSYSVRTLQRTLGVDLDALREYNLALRDPFWSGRRYAPVGYTLRLPRTSETKSAEAVLASTPADVEPKTKRVAVASAGARYRVKQGDSLGSLARRFGVSEEALMAANGLRHPRQLKVGQVLKVPAAKRRSAAQDGAELVGARG
ncbi:MAG TPA: transglycosylase SLT domain-containing protein [Myxococcota bacterium]|nr:transglycosylase SLT domain-containing protein [Myxococcota bacterium]